MTTQVGQVRHVRLERDGAVALLIVDRPDARNALDPETMRSLDARIEDLESSHDVRAVVICGGGGRFISGGDLRALSALRTVDEGREMALRMQRILARLEALPMPVIAAIDGYAYGGGAEVAVAADLRVAAADAVLGFRQTQFAVSTAWGGARRLAALVGRSRALRLLWTACDVSAHEALAMGLVDRIADRHADRAGSPPAARVALEWAQSLARRPPLALRACKRIVSASGVMTPEEHGPFEAEIFAETWASPAHWEAVERHWAKRGANQPPSIEGTPRPNGRPVNSPPADRAQIDNPRSGPTPSVVAPAQTPRPDTPRKRGRFIVFEGLDGAGTTTQARMLATWLREGGARVHETAEPSGGPIGTFIRQALSKRVVEPGGERLAPEVIAALFAADRVDHLRSEITPALDAGVDVICDRYAGSSIAYQGAEADTDWVAAINAPMPPPDLVLYLRVDADVAAVRRAQRGQMQELYEVTAFQRKVAALYDRMQSWRPDDTVALVDGLGDVHTVQRACRQAILARWNPGEIT